MDKRYASFSIFRFLRTFNKPANVTTPGQCKPIQHESLENILKDKLLSELFHDWAAQNLCSENLLFFYEVEKYKAIKDPFLMKAEAHRIYAKFVRPRSVAEVNLDYDCREAIEEELANPSTTIFDDAKYVIHDLIKYDLYLKFTDSDIYRNFKGLPSAHRYPQQRRRNIHMADMPHISYDQISSLSKCLSDPLTSDEFLKFAYTEFSDAVVQFYLAVEQYENSPSYEFANSIFDKYLDRASEEEVDADPKIKRWIKEQLGAGLFPRQLFTSLKLQVYAVMVQDNFMRFQNHIITRLAMV